MIAREVYQRVVQLCVSQHARNTPSNTQVQLAAASIQSNRQAQTDSTGLYLLREEWRTPFGHYREPPCETKRTAWALTRTIFWALSATCSLQLRAVTTVRHRLHVAIIGVISAQASTLTMSPFSWPLVYVALLLEGFDITCSMHFRLQYFMIMTGNRIRGAERELGMAMARYKASYWAGSIVIIILCPRRNLVTGQPVKHVVYMYLLLVILVVVDD